MNFFQVNFYMQHQLHSSSYRYSLVIQTGCILCLFSITLQLYTCFYRHFVLVGLIKCLQLSLITERQQSGKSKSVYGDAEVGDKGGGG